MSKLIPDPPDIRMTEETGYPKEVKWPRCPICNEECEQVYENRDGEAFGCENCVTIRDAWDVQNEDY